MRRVILGIAFGTTAIWLAAETYGLATGMPYVPPSRLVLIGLLLAVTLLALGDALGDGK